MAVDIKDLMHRYKRLDQERATWREHWEELAEFCAPRRMGFVGRHPQGEKRTRRLYNPIGVMSVQTLASALHGLMMNPTQRWMELRMEEDALNEREDVRQWLDDVGQRILNSLQSPATAFHVHVNQLMEDLAAFGTACLYIGQQQSGPLFVRSYSIGCVLIAENQYGAIDTVMREAPTTTVRQAVQQWGGRVSKKTREMYDKGNYDKEINIVHVVQPRKELDSTKRDPINMPLASIYFEEKAEHLLEEGGDEEMPYLTPRWGVASGETYGRSPAMTALPAIKVANEGQRIVLRAAEKSVDPPLVVPHEGVVSPVRSVAGGLTYVRNRQEITQLPTSANLPFAADWLQAQNNEIRTTFLIDQLQFTMDTRMTATEVLQRQSERFRLLGPVHGRIENELLNPLVVRAYGLLNRVGLLPEPPEDVEGKDFKVEYQSPLARAQKQNMANGFVQAMAILEPVGKINPDLVFGPIAMEKMTSTVFDWFGVPPDLLKSEDTMAQDARNAMVSRIMQMLPLLGQFASGAGKGIESGAKAGLASTEAAGLAAQLAQAMPQLMQLFQQQGVLPQQNPARGRAPNVAQLAGSAASSIAQVAPAAIGTPQQAVQAYQGR